MKAKIIDLPKKKAGRPRAELPRRELLLSMRERGLTLREISSRTGTPLSTLGDALKSRLTPELEKKRRRRKRKERYAGQTSVNEKTGSFWCHACLEDRPTTEQSPDLRYCRQCNDFLIKEVELLSSSGEQAWAPKPKC